jgi:hypothetical protein
MSGINPPVLQQSGSNRSHRALVRGGELLKRAAGVEGREELAILVLGPRLTGLLRHLALAALES